MNVFKPGTRLSDEQIQAARDMSTCEVISAITGFSFERAGSEWKCKEHNSLRVFKDGKGWIWYSQNISGATSIDFLMKSEGYSWQQAVTTLTNGQYTPSSYSYHKDEQPEKPKQLNLPERTPGKYSRVYAYLMKQRCIDVEVINYCVKNEILYEDKRGNCVFVGKDDTGKPKCSPECNPSCGCGKYVEIWNNVFMEFYKDENGKYSKLKQHNVDTGLGLERMAMLLQGKETPFETELFTPIMDKLVELEKVDNIASRRIVAEHLRSSMMIICDGGRPSNVDRGYILRRLIRRMVRHMNKLQISLDELVTLIDLNVENLKEMYPSLEINKETIKTVIIEEKDKFVKTLVKGEKEFEKEVGQVKAQGENIVPGKVVFRLYDTYGFPPEVTEELATESGMSIDKEEFEKLFKEHQEKSRAGSEQKFKGGLASTGEMETKYHTATHLLNAALKQVLGSHVHQRGSNITAERMRFDFSHPTKMTDEEKKATEDLVNEWIKEAIPVEHLEMKKDDAIKMGAEAMFIEKYGDIVSVYKIGDKSIELCGGPHVHNTSELGHFKIKKEESSSSGVRRIKAILD